VKLAIIAAMTESRVIGIDNRLPWRLPEDLKRFKALTMGHPVLMGRHTFESIGKPLPGRTNIVLSRDRTLAERGVQVAANLDQALAACAALAPKPEIAFVIGGAARFAEALPKADRLHLTIIHKEFAGDTRFPDYRLEPDFEVVRRESGVSRDDPTLRFTFIDADRHRAP
jgi:dihydrofolate reductase